MKQLSTSVVVATPARRQFIWNMARLLIVAALVLFAVAGYRGGDLPEQPRGRAAGYRSRRRGAI
ncbi:MAG: hypothetical protein R3D28_11095 [Geminicoccaceae bacterium]